MQARTVTSAGISRIVAFTDPAVLALFGLPAQAGPQAGDAAHGD